MTTNLPTLPKEPLSKREKNLLIELEGKIEENIRGFKIVGHALTIICNQRLYRIHYDTFEEYCREEWDLGRARAYQLMDGYSVVENLSTIVDKKNSTPFDILPVTESQARPLASLTPEQQIEIWITVIDTARKEERKITAALVQRCIDEACHKKITNAIDKAKKAVSRQERVLPEDIQHVFNGVFEVVQHEADTNWKRVKPQELAVPLRELLFLIES